MLALKNILFVMNFFSERNKIMDKKNQRKNMMNCLEYRYERKYKK